MPDDPNPILDYATYDTRKWITIANFPSEFTAHLAASLLEAHDIAVYLEPNLFSPSGHHPTKMIVEAQDLEPATTILQNSPASQFLVRT